MNAIEVPLPSRYPKIALFTLWIGAFLAAALVSMFDAWIRGQNLAAPIVRTTLLLGLVGIGAGIALTTLFVRLRVTRLCTVTLITITLFVAVFCLSRIAISLSPGLGLDLIIGLLAVLCSMVVYAALFILAVLWTRGLSRLP